MRRFFHEAIWQNYVLFSSGSAGIWPAAAYLHSGSRACSAGGFYTKGATSIDDCMDAFLNIISTANFNAGVSAAYGTVALVVFAYWYYKKFRPTEPENVRKPFNIPVIFGILITAVGLQYITNYIVSFTAAINPHWLEYYSNLVESVGLDEPSLILVLYSVLIGPVCEELIFMD